ncbi:pyrroline-5-carboxylate reductase [Marinimicrobium alkaliphilum]|uniref:pyrroline-5-carboxylate reductase n=1 Tax=Marinimicrobium alkaliphilum TaxID=2202654 RepID=UPI000DB9273A|nr:pyrroline-5-carboxylate reductase [Marinimicrobium alkaliphilum]
MTHPKLAFIGAGNMARSIIGGLVAEGYPADAISASDLHQDTLDAMVRDFGIGVGASDTLAANADVIVLAVKPQGLKAVAQSLQPSLTHRPLIISIAAGITAESLAQWLGQEQAIVRCMPNTPSLVKAGASGLFANTHTSNTQKAVAEQVMSAVGLVEWFDDERQLDAVTAVSGSGPAYYFLVMEAMIDAAESLGLPRDSATRLTLQTALGAAELARASDVDVAELRRRVMSPGGTTERAIQSFEQDQLRATFARAMTLCAERSAELAKELGN